MIAIGPCYWSVLQYLDISFFIDGAAHVIGDHPESLSVDYFTCRVGLGVGLSSGQAQVRLLIGV